jgi:gliding motility-associated-like protein
MAKTGTYLIFLHCFIFLSPAVWGQCGYKAEINTNHNYCLGSSLLVRADYPLERIVWYKNGQPVDSALANQSIPAAGIPIKVPGLRTGVDINCDPSGQIYLFNDQNEYTVKYTGGLTVVVDSVGTRLFVDQQDNVYITNQTEATVREYPADGSPGTVIASGVPSPYNGYGSALYVDCQGAVYVGDESQSSVTKWLPGATSGQLVAGGPGSGIFPLQVRVDSLGNVFVLGGLEITEWATGSGGPVRIGSWNAPQNLFSDMWMDGKDTAYLADWKDPSNIKVFKWGLGSSVPQEIGSFGTGIGGATPPALTVTPNGDIYVVEGEDSSFYRFPRFSSIDSAFTPTDTGSYYAVVTDMNGYAATTNTIVINAPLTGGPPAIQITATTDSTPVCTPVTFTVAVGNPGVDAAYQWMVSGVPVGGDSTTYSNNLFADGDEVYCILMAQDGCSGPVSDTSNMIRMGINAEGAATVTIAASSKTNICSGQAVSFTATVMNGSANPVFKWLVNGDSTGDDSSMFTRSNFLNGDVVTCLITADDACGLAKSNSIPLTVSIPPVIQPGQIFTISRGGSLTLDPVVSGTVNTWAWSPGSWLSDSTIADPVADPPASVTYTLMVEANGGCGDTATILVDVFTPLAIPNAFTPNGDGRNDRFYVLGGPVNSVVETFDVFNRWGQAVFRVHDVAPGDAGAGWDGRVNGSPAPPGTYVYLVVMRFATGARQMYKGTVEVIR